MQLAPIWPWRIPRLRVWLAILCVAHGLDIATTAFGLHQGIPEGNPLMSSVLHGHSELAMYGLKLALVAGLILAIGYVQQRYRRVWPILLAMTIPAVLVVLNNFAVIAEAHG